MDVFFPLVWERTCFGSKAVKNVNVNRPGMGKNCFLLPRLYLKFPNRWDHQAWTLQNSCFNLLLLRVINFLSEPVFFLPSSIVFVQMLRQWNRQQQQPKWMDGCSLPSTSTDTAEIKNIEGCFCDHFWLNVLCCVVFQLFSIFSLNFRRPWDGPKQYIVFMWYKSPDSPPLL